MPETPDRSCRLSASIDARLLRGVSSKTIEGSRATCGGVLACGVLAASLLISIKRLLGLLVQNEPPTGWSGHVSTCRWSPATCKGVHANARWELWWCSPRRRLRASNFRIDRIGDSTTCIDARAAVRQHLTCGVGVRPCEPARAQKYAVRVELMLASCRKFTVSDAGVALPKRRRMQSRSWAHARRELPIGSERRRRERGHAWDCAGAGEVGLRTERIVGARSARFLIRE